MKRYDSFDDEYLVELAQRGNAEAEEAIIRRYKDTVKLKAKPYFIIGADSEDVVQEGMIGIFKAVKSYRPEKEASFKTFAELCINRQIFTAIQRAARQKHSPLNNFVSLSRSAGDTRDREAPEMMITAPSTEEPETRTVMKDFIDKIVTNTPALLSDFEKKVWYRYLQGRSYVQIAEEMERSPKSVDNALQRIKKKITTFLSE